jgi:signal transduction histidine kinase
VLALSAVRNNDKVGRVLFSDQVEAYIPPLKGRQHGLRLVREALDSVAHDLRTPLTRLRTGAEVALRDGVDPQRARDALADTLEESDRVLARLRTLMDISEAETGVMKLERTRVDLRELARGSGSSPI